MIRRYSKKIAALVLSLTLATSVVGSPAVFAAENNESNVAVTLMSEVDTSESNQSSVINTFMWSGSIVTAAAETEGYTIDNGSLTISSAGIYKLTGTGIGNVIVKSDNVTLMLDGLQLETDKANTIESTASDTVIQVKGDNTLTNCYEAEEAEIAAICSFGQTITVTGTGTLNLNSTGEDGSGIHADYTLNIGTEGSSEGPSIKINAVNEGIEALTLNLYSGSGSIVSDDDGINADNDADESQPCNLNIYGGSWTINSCSDGLDSNGNITVSGGTTVVYGSTENDNSAIDFDGTLTFTGGTLVGIGMNGMAQTPTTGNYVEFQNINGILEGSKLEIKDVDGNIVYTAEAVKNADDVVLATYDLTEGETYTLFVDGEEVSDAEAASSGRTGGPGQGNESGQPGENGGQMPPDQNGDQPPQMPISNFTDVSSSDYFSEPVYWAAATNITTGTSETTFSPFDLTTRGQIVTFLWRLAGSPEPSATETSYTDIDADAYYYKAVLWAAEKGITTGTSESTFSPEESCTRSQIVTFLYRYAESPKTENNTSFSDVDTDAYYADAVAWAAVNAITSGTSESTFSPEDSCTRGQAVTFLYNYAKLTGQVGSDMVVPTGDRPEPPSGNPGDNPEPPAGENGEAPSGNPPELPSSEEASVPATN